MADKIKRREAKKAYKENVLSKTNNAPSFKDAYNNAKAAQYDQNGDWRNNAQDARKMFLSMNSSAPIVSTTESISIPGYEGIPNAKELIEIVPLRRTSSVVNEEPKETPEVKKSIPAPAKTESINFDSMKFGDAFAAAKKAGLKVFDYKGKKFNTLTKEEAEAAKKAAADKPSTVKSVAPSKSDVPVKENSNPSILDMAYSVEGISPYLDANMMSGWKDIATSDNAVSQVYNDWKDNQLSPYSYKGKQLTYGEYNDLLASRKAAYNAGSDFVPAYTVQESYNDNIINTPVESTVSTPYSYKGEPLTKEQYEALRAERAANYGKPQTVTISSTPINKGAHIARIVSNASVGGDVIIDPANQMQSAINNPDDVRTAYEITKKTPSQMEQWDKNAAITTAAGLGAIAAIEVSPYIVSGLRPTNVSRAISREIPTVEAVRARYPGQWIYTHGDDIARAIEYGIPVHKNGGKIQSIKKLQNGGPVERRQLNSWDSSIADRVWYGLTDKLGKTKKPAGEPSLKESATGQEMARFMDSAPAHLLPGVSAVSFSRDAVKDAKDGRYGMAAADLIGAFGLNYPFAQEVADAAKFAKWSKTPQSLVGQKISKLGNFYSGEPLTYALPSYPTSTMQFGIPTFGLASYLKGVAGEKGEKE